VKANEVTQQGYYWALFGTSDPTIVEASNRSKNAEFVFWFVGRDDESYINEMSNCELFGPLEYKQDA
jgi:hypothetical protein